LLPLLLSYFEETNKLFLLHVRVAVLRKMRLTANPSKSFWIEKESSVVRNVSTSAPLHDVDVVIIGTQKQKSSNH
jgi:hypothetical protein